MAYAYWSEGRADNYAVFDLFFRKNPFKGEFCVFAGLEEVIRFVESFRCDVPCFDPLSLDVSIDLPLTISII
jgi:nicotinic acid phosphoribosyltransferase